MKFGKSYAEYLESQGFSDLSFVRFKWHKKLLKRCPHRPGESSSWNAESYDSTNIPKKDCGPCSGSAPICSLSKDCAPCSECDFIFFPYLMEEAAAVVSIFNAQAQKLLRFHLTSGVRKCMLLLKNKIARDKVAMVQEGKRLVIYGFMNALAIRKILKKYDKVHSSVAGRAFKTQLQVMRIELLQSPLLLQLGALAENLKSSNYLQLLPRKEHNESGSSSFDENRRIMSYALSEQVKIEYDLTCSICLEMVFDPIALGCGHIFCNSCGCLAADVLMFQGIKTAKRTSKCPLCRQVGVYMDAMPLSEVHILLSSRCKDYYQERLIKERRLHLQQTKEYWDKELANMMGF